MLLVDAVAYREVVGIASRCFSDPAEAYLGNTCVSLKLSEAVKSLMAKK